MSKHAPIPCSFLLSLHLLLLAAPAQAGPVTTPETCAPLAAGASVTVTYQEQPVHTDDTLDVRRLTAISGNESLAHHNVLGLTHAVPDYRVTGNMRFTPDAAGGVCASPDITVTVGLSELTVYLAREITDACRRQVIREHEAEHVRVWQQFLRAGARMMEIQLRRELAVPRHYASPLEAEKAGQQWVNGLLGAKVKALSEEIRLAQRSVDSPISYAQVAGRLRACPPPP